MALEDDSTGGRQEFRPPVDHRRSDWPDLGVRTSRFEPLSRPSGPSLLLVVGDGLAELAPRTDVEEVCLLVSGAHPVYGDAERAYRHARLGEAQFGVASEVTSEDHAVETDHEYLP